jgi:hypothetical protein
MRNRTSWIKVAAIGLVALAGCREHGPANEGGGGAATSRTSTGFSSSSKGTGLSAEAPEATSAVDRDRPKVNDGSTSGLGSGGQVPGAVTPR